MDDLMLVYRLCLLVTTLQVTSQVSGSHSSPGHGGHRPHVLWNSTQSGGRGSPDNLMYMDSPTSTGDVGDTLEEVIAVRGQKVTLDCSAREGRNDPYPQDEDIQTVRWYHDDKEIAADMRISWSVTGILEISHAVSADSGIWRCLAVEGNLGDPLRLVVTIPPERPFLVYAGAQLAAGARLTTREGNPLTLHCIVEGGNPAPTLSWHLNRVDVSHNSKMRSDWSKSEERFTTISNITLASVDKDQHNATIACVVAHPALRSPVPVPLKLNIEYPPDFRLRRWPTWGSPIREGTSVSLLCLIDANPPSPPVWVKETDGKAEEIGGGSGWLNLTHISMENRGWYKCTTVHPFGHFASNSVLLNVLAAGKIQIAPPRMIEASVGDSLSLPCTAPGISSNSICWKRILSDGRHKGVSKQNALQLRKVSYSDSGIYKCTSTVDEDTVLESENVQLYVTGSPILKALNRSVEAIYGSSVTLIVKICSEPTVLDLMWVTPQRRSHIFPGETNTRYSFLNLTILDTEGCQNAGMKISKLLPQDSGRWVLMAVNDRGADAALITVNVTEAAHHAVAASTAGAAHVHSKPLPGAVLSISLLPILLTIVGQNNVLKNNYYNFRLPPLSSLLVMLSTWVPSVLAMTAMIAVNMSMMMSCDFLCLL